MEWNSVVNMVSPYIVRVDTPDGHGTGFLCLYNQTRTFFGIATARHVVAQADEWHQPIKLTHFPTNKTAFLKESDRIIFPDEDTDSAVILVPADKLDLPEEPIQLLPTGITLEVGTDVGWLGYPGIRPNTLCFFCGVVSAMQDKGHSYLIDGVAINGVSGGPVVYSTPAYGVRIIGTISAYVSNKATPGLAIARDVSHFHSIIVWMKNMDQAREEKEKQQEQKIEQSGSSPNSNTTVTFE